MRRARHRFAVGASRLLPDAVTKLGSALLRHAQPRTKKDLLGSVSRRLFFETLEPRVLLSADLSPIVGSIDVPGETDQYAFSLAQKATIYFDSQTPNAGLTWSLTGPDGAKVTDRSLASSDSTGAGANSPVLGLVSGDYTLSVSGIGDVTGAYKFRLMDLANATPIQSGVPISGQLDPGSATNLYSFTGNAGDHLFLDQLSATNPAAMTWHLLDRNGTQVVSSGFADLDVPALKLSGTYTLAVEGTVDSRAPSNYSFAVRPVADTQAALAIGAVTSGAITGPGQASNYTFSLNSSTSLYFDSLTNDPALLWSLSGPRGQEVTGKSFSASDASAAGTSNPVLNMVAGNYSLKVTGSGDHLGAFAFQLVGLQAAGTHIDFGQQIDGTLNPANGTCGAALASDLPRRRRHRDHMGARQRRPPVRRLDVN
jgi:hypothetical protein